MRSLHLFQEMTQRLKVIRATNQTNRTKKEKLNKILLLGTTKSIKLTWEIRVQEDKTHFMNPVFIQMRMIIVIVKHKMSLSLKNNRKKHQNYYLFQTNKKKSSQKQKLIWISMMPDNLKRVPSHLHQNLLYQKEQMDQLTLIVKENSQNKEQLQLTWKGKVRK